MLCVVCSGPGRSRLCDRCTGRLRPGGVRRLADGLLVASGLLHEEPARTLVHRLKYQGIRQAAGILAPYMAAALDGLSGGLVPIPRVLARRWKHAIDPAKELAWALGSITGLPVLDILAVPVWAPARAGRRRASRSAPKLTIHSMPSSPVILVDDVLTTGSTLQAARRAIGGSVMYGITATSAGRVVV